MMGSIVRDFSIFLPVSRTESVIRCITRFATEPSAVNCTLTVSTASINGLKLQAAAASSTSLNDFFPFLNSRDLSSFSRVFIDSFAFRSKFAFSNSIRTTLLSIVLIPKSPPSRYYLPSPQIRDVVLG